jgi:hypothetical protein
LANQIVEFSLTIEAGGLQLGNASDVSDANSKVSTEVFVGDIPISVRVNASVCAAGGQFHNRRGVVESSCLTSAGVCAVTWTTTQPRPTNGRGTVLATAIGHETLCDSNGNNVLMMVARLKIHSIRKVVLVPMCFRKLVLSTIQKLGVIITKMAKEALVSCF